MLTFNGIEFDSEASLLAWLKQEYLASQTTIENLQKSLNDASKNANFWKSEHDDAVRELRQVYKDLNSAEREIVDLEYDRRY